MVAMERPDWQAVMAYVTSIYKHFELDQKSWDRTCDYYDDQTARDQLENWLSAEINICHDGDHNENSKQDSSSSVLNFTVEKGARQQ